MSTNPRKRDARKYVHPHTELISTARLCNATAHSHQDRTGASGWLLLSLLQRHSLGTDGRAPTLDHGSFPWKQRENNYFLSSHHSTHPKMAAETPFCNIKQIKEEKERIRKAA